jgi:hypothetical protein
MCFSSPSIPKPKDPLPPTPPPPVLEPMEFQPTESANPKKPRKLGTEKLQIPLGGITGTTSGLGIPTTGG